MADILYIERIQWRGGGGRTVIWLVLWDRIWLELKRRGAFDVLSVVV